MTSGTDGLKPEAASQDEAAARQRRLAARREAARSCRASPDSARQSLASSGGSHDHQNAWVSGVRGQAQAAAEASAGEPNLEFPRPVRQGTCLASQSGSLVICNAGLNTAVDAGFRLLSAHIIKNLISTLH